MFKKWPRVVVHNHSPHPSSPHGNLLRGKSWERGARGDVQGSRRHPPRRLPPQTVRRGRRLRGHRQRRKTRHRVVRKRHRPCRPTGRAQVSHLQSSQLHGKPRFSSEFILVYTILHVVHFFWLSVKLRVQYLIPIYSGSNISIEIEM